MFGKGDVFGLVGDDIQCFFDVYLRDKKYRICMFVWTHFPNRAVLVILLFGLSDILLRFIFLIAVIEKASHSSPTDQSQVSCLSLDVTGHCFQRSWFLRHINHMILSRSNLIHHFNLRPCITHPQDLVDEGIYIPRFPSTQERKLLQHSPYNVIQNPQMMPQ